MMTAMSAPTDPPSSSHEPLRENPSPAPGLIDLACFTREDGASTSPDGAGDIAAPGSLIGRYELKQLLGEGGFGMVWKALQWEPIRREVALKVIKPGMDSREIIGRFETERQSLALMDHPNIAAVFDAGSTSAGRPYFVMELVQGLPITTYCDQHQLSIEQRLELFIPVCQAVQHAHQKAILHRDLKPSNILVADLDGRPVPKVIDFGIAKALGGPADDAGSPLRQLRTHSGMIIGTPQYMSPEQAGSLPDVDTRSDIYTLGVILYELLTGRVPLQEDPALPSGFEELLRRVREQTPPRPSQVLLTPAQKEETTVAATARRLDTTRLARRLRGDLDWVVMKALEKDRNRRYESATALAQDIRRHLRQEPVSAAAPTWSYQASKFVRRHRTIVTAGATVAAALVAATFISYTQAARAIQAGKDTQKALDQSRKSQAEAQANLARAREAVDQFLNKVTDDRRLSQANLQSLRQQLLETALPFYQQFVAQQSDDPAVRLEQAGAYLRLGTISFVIGDTAQAETSLRKAISGLGQLPETARTAPKAKQIEAKSLQVLGVVQQKLGRTDESDVSLRKAIQILEDLAARFPTEAVFASELTTSHANLGLLLSGLAEDDSRGQSRADSGNDSARFGPADAEAAFQSALTAASQLGAARPATVGANAPLALALRGHGAFLAKGGRWADAEAVLRRALVLQERLTQEAPQTQDHQLGLSRILTDLAKCCSQQNRPEDAATASRRAMEVLGDLAARFPDVIEYRSALAVGTGNHGWLLFRADQFGPAEEAFHKTVALQELLMKQNPAVPEYRLAMAEGLHGLGVVQWRLGRQQEAEQTMLRGIKEKEELVSAFPSLTEYRNSLVKTLCQLASLIDETPGWERARPLLQKALAQQVVTLKGAPGNRHYAQILVSIHFAMTGIHLKSGDPEAALKEVQTIRQMADKDPEALRKIIYLMTTILPVVQKDEKLTPEARRVIIETQARQALAWLWQYKKDRAGTLPADAFGGEEIFFTAHLQGVPSLVAAPEQKPPAPAVPAGAPQPGDRLPRRFTYDYKFTDPGVRIWVREGDIWTETQPSGRQNVLRIIGRTAVEGVEGSLLGRSDVPSMQVFIPDRSTTGKMHLKARNNKDSPWYHLGSMQNIE